MQNEAHHRRYAVITLFPEMFKSITESGISSRAIKKRLIEVAFFNPRNYATDKHQTVDDRPYGGGPGMVMRVEPLKAALLDALKWFDKPKSQVEVIYLSPQGKKLDNQGVAEISAFKDVLFVAGRYEGIDERFIESCVDSEWSIGDFVLSGGELPAMVLIDAIIRKLPGALGDDRSALEDSFENGLLDYPHYTRPEVALGKSVPDVLLSGDHKKIEDWRMCEAVKRTIEKRPDLIDHAELNEVQREYLKRYFLG